MTAIVKDISVFAPELFLALLGMLVLVADLVLPRSWRKELAAVAGLGLLVAVLPVLSVWGRGPVTDFSGAFVADNLSVLFKLVFVVAGALTVLLSADRLLLLRRGFGEFFMVLVFFVLGLCLMASAGDLIILYLAFELSSLSGYLLAAWLRDDRLSSEAGLKYFIFGAAASGVMLYGLSLMYGLAGSLEIDRVGAAMAQGGLLGALAGALVLVGLGYKISMTPFHWWAPDVYQGAPTAVTAFLSVGPKLAGFALILRVLQPLIASAPQVWTMVLAVLCAITMFTGNLLAIRQKNIKRLLAYSSIAHAGYMLIGVTAATVDPIGLQAVAVYAVAYLFMNLGAFGVAIFVEHRTGSSQIEAFAGLARQAPGVALAMVIFLLSLVGIPPTAGFVGKLLLFGTAIKVPGLAWLAVLGIINSAISVYYYMNIARTMYFDTVETRRAEGSSPAAVMIAVVVALVGTLVVGLGPQSLIAAAENSSRLLGGL